jgi:carboxypeptidase Taq
MFTSTANLLGWDQETNMPARAAPYRSEQLATLAGLSHRLSTEPDIGDWLDECEQHFSTDTTHGDDERLSQIVNVRAWRRDYERTKRLPPLLVEEFARTTALAREPWNQARRESNFGKFAPWLAKIVHLCQQQAECWGYDGCAYDALLDGYEPGACVADLAVLFRELEREITALLPSAVAATAGDSPHTGRHYPVSAQQEFNRKVIAAIGFDFSAGRVDVSSHPFCTDIGQNDCRLTTRYSELDFVSSLLFAMHETGHALYSQGLPERHFGTPAGASVSIGIHESQSRLWENQVGRSRGFWQYWYPVAVSHFPEFDLSFDQFLSWSNRVTPSHIRIASDEVTYNLHIILRFEMEQMLIGGQLAVSDLPSAWNERFEDLFGLSVPDDARGCLQDVHWSVGAFGYFPTYALGTLNAAQLFDAASRAIVGLDDELRAARYGHLLTWLRDNIHRHGRRHSPDQLMRMATGEPTSAKAFLRYLRATYGI